MHARMLRYRSAVPRSNTGATTARARRRSAGTHAPNRAWSRPARARREAAVPGVAAALHREPDGEVIFELVAAVDDPKETERFFAGLRACYQRFNAGVVAKTDRERGTWEGVTLVIAYKATTGEMLGGVGIYERLAGAPLPIEMAIGDDPALCAALDRWHDRRVVELSGLWMEDTWRRSGLSGQLMLMAMAAAAHLGAAKIVGFGHQHVLAFYGTFGLVADPSLGVYHYPDNNYVSTFIHADAATLENANAELRAQIFALIRSLAEGARILGRVSPRAAQSANVNTSSTARRSEGASSQSA